jgi:allantoinase
MLDARVIGGTVVSPTGQGRLDLGIAEGRVVGLFEPGLAPEARQTIDATDLLVLPGVVDAHFHCRAPGHPQREDFSTGTQAAAAGGATTVLEMPIAYPGVHSGEVLNARRELGEAQAHVDFGLYGGGGSSAEGIREMAEAGAIAFKIFLHGAPAGREIEFEGLTATDTVSLYRAFERIAATGLPVAVHSEDDDLIEARISDLRARGQGDTAAHQDSRPDFVEAVAVAKVLLLAEETGVRLHLPHVSTGKAVQLVREVRARGQRVSLETCPHYLFANSEDFARAGFYAKINPPIRPESDREAMWQAVLDGTVDIVASDHAPYRAAEKEHPVIFDCPSGSAGIETMAPALLDRALTGELTLERVVDLLCERPARLFDLYPRKGALLPGSDADLLLFDPAASWLVDHERFFTKSRDAARLFHGRTFRGRIRRTLVRGQLVYDDGQIVGQAGHGQFLTPLVASARRPTLNQ